MADNKLFDSDNLDVFAGCPTLVAFLGDSVGTILSVLGAFNSRNAPREASIAIVTSWPATPKLLNPR